MANHARAVRLIALAAVAAGCWRGAVTEPAELGPAPVPARRAPAPGASRPARGPALSSSSPGPLTRGHEPWDTDTGCLRCHVRVGARAPLANERCLGCHDHDDVATRIAARQGLHASGFVAGRRCEQCHHEHRGRGYDNLGWQSVPGGAARFDHALTGWPLDAASARMPCTQCHTRRNAGGLTLYLGLDRAQFP